MDVAADPTLPRTRDVRCGKCGHQEAVFFQVRARVGPADRGASGRGLGVGCRA